MKEHKNSDNKSNENKENEQTTKETSEDNNTIKEETKETKSDCEEKLQQLNNSYLRLQAEFANYKRRNENLVEETFNLGVNKVLSKIIDVYDDFDLALSNKNCSFEDFKKGMELIYSKLHSVGEDFNLEIISCVGEEFNPRLHEALLTEKSDKKENIVLEELQKGYKIKEVVLRHSKVKVSKK